jgi:hypothetical protein
MTLEYLFLDVEVAEKVGHLLLHSLARVGLVVELRTRCAGRLHVGLAYVGISYSDGCSKYLWGVFQRVWSFQRDENVLVGASCFLE